ncbi:MAG: glutamine-hydrolyzing carbamoyl-phosphate synthase small subunit [Anaerolineaceae bacterium]|nr:glutamine-hydrolyzing carbamoyl-phosphate synthase small subunit [Anaerolineaceae bacterium]
MDPTPATLALEDGSVYSGEAFGASADAVFELVFNTSMSGYQEILSDPSYRGQGVLFTTSHIGNVGANPADNEADRPQAAAAVVRALNHTVSSWRAADGLSPWLARYGVPGISGIDTRSLTHKLRRQGTLKAALSTCGTPAPALLEAARQWSGLDGRDMVREVTCPAPSRWDGDPGSAWVKPVEKGPFHVVAFDFGAKRNILRHLAARAGRVTIVPAYTTFEEVQALAPDGVFLSTGPGDPAGLPSIVAVVRQLIDSGVPTFGICLGQQLIGRALGGETQRLKFGHHSGNHPVQDLHTRRVLVTAQNHNYAVDPHSLDPNLVELTHVSLNDGTLEGLRLRHRPVFSVQFHPEASPGPHDAHGLFARFFELIEAQPTHHS